ncbi:MAG: glycosyltransferase family 2 protein, partial [Isosphaeraceae bacterium]
LTVAIPTCNGAAHLAETLDSVLAQSDADFDLLVSDDRSEDGTLELVREHAGPRAKVVRNDERLGLAGNWNQCVALCRTPWISIFHQDDVMKPGHLAWVLRQIERLGDASRTGLIAGPVEVIDDQSRPVSPRVIDPGGICYSARPPQGVDFDDLPPGELTDLLGWHNPLRCSAVVTSKAAHADVGGFDAAYRYVVDWDFWYRVASRWGVCWKLGEPGVQVRWHSASETHRFKTGIEDLEEAGRLIDRISDIERQDQGRESDARRFASSHLARALLNRSHEALQSGQMDLARTCLRRAVTLSPTGVAATAAADPRLAVQMASLWLSPRLARRWFTRQR